MAQLKKLSQLMDTAGLEADESAKKTENERNDALREIGNLLHESVIVSNDEVLAFSKYVVMNGNLKYYILILYYIMYSVIKLEIL